MKANRFSAALAALLLATAGSFQSTFGAAAPGATQGSAKVATLIGNATFTDGAGGAGQLRQGQTLSAGATVNTSPNATVVLDLGDNGQALEIKPDSTLKIDTLTKQQTGAETAIKTELEVKKGSVVGNVKKLSKASTYEVKTANGVAGIRGTSFHIFAVGIFRCASGALIVRVFDLTTGGSRTFTVPQGREITTPPPTRPGETRPPDPRPQLIQVELLSVLVADVNMASRIVNTTIINNPNAPSITVVQQAAVNTAVANAVASILATGSGQQQNQELTDAQRVAAFLVTKCGANGSTDPLVTTANAAYARAISEGKPAPVAAAIAIAICQTHALTLTDSLYRSAVQAEVGYVRLISLPTDLNTIPVSPIGGGI